MAKPGTRKSDLAETLEQVTEIAEDSLDPELSREDLVRRLKDIANLAADDEADDEDEDEDDD